MTQQSDLAWYVYAVTEPRLPAPDVAGLLCDTTVDTIPFGPLGVLATLVPRTLFEAEHPDNRTADPDWMAARVAAHHAVVSAATVRQACLPLGFGTLFSSLDRLAAWMQPRETALLAGLARIAGQAEWSLRLQEDTARHGAWLDRHDGELQRLALLAENAGVGTAFLMAKRIDKARVAARIAHLETVETRIGDHLALAGWPALAERRRDGSAAWSILAPPNAGDAALGQIWLAALAEELAPSGLAASLSGPWPAYAFAKGALQSEPEHA